jgi:hypothetical protein
MRGARPAGREADPDLAGEFCMGYRHERRHFLVPELDELDRLRTLQRAEHAIDAVARITINPAHPSLVKTADEKIADFHGLLRLT